MTYQGDEGQIFYVEGQSMSNIPPDRCRVPQAFWRVIERIGLTAASVLRQARLPGTLHLNDQGFVTTAQYFSLWKALEDLTADPGVGIRLVTGTETALHPPPSLCAFYARDYRDGLARTARFKRLCTPEQLHFAEEENTYTIRTSWLHATEPAPTIATEVAFACLIELGRRGTGRHLTPHCVEFTCTAPKSDVHSAYFGCAIHYGASQNALVLKPADLDHPFPGHNPELLEMLTPVLASALDEIQAHSSIREQVKIVLKRSMPSGRPELSEVARDLAMSERTLQRRITEEDATFRELLIEARQELGRQLLSDHSATIDEVAYLLGYQDTSSFYRAFRDWEGLTPSQWRGINRDDSLAQTIPPTMPH
jgi:AraC-like DNA-binding protein